MKRIKWIYAILFLGLAALWLLDEQPWSRAYSNFFELRASVVNFTGFLAMGAMSLAMILAIRPVRIEPVTGGLDKSYRLHKWLGISALVVGVIHWLWAEGVKWAVGWGWLEKPVRAARPQIDDAIQQFMMQMHRPAEQVGEWAFYAAAILILVALIKWFPYRHFFKTHRVIAIAYLVLVFHSVFLIKFPQWQSSITWISVLLMAGGTVGAVLSLTRRIGHQRRALGTVEAVTFNEGDQVLKIDIRLARDHWDGHDAGQFAFLSFHDGEGAHPFTISSAWKNDGLLHFHVKNLGDYTARLPGALEPGQRATVEGPYGCFRFGSDRPRQVWVAGGIGITPFMARMEELTHRGQTKNEIDLFYSTKQPDEIFIEHLRRLAEASGVRLHLIVAGRDALFDAEKLCAEVPEWKDASLWFCGPAGFGHALRQGLDARGFDTAHHFHQELFDMR